ncbi:hypothetical protein JUJ52_02990 [Virgibacillus sp. AGTR]|uniref:hypothetical protein n=1 Tax=Virgibacillus sp. AGTR TaxID=2812055 RepID=UPI001D16C364|nr:hypothetical protein [Virgibacillus sp. AGTR]MCC2248923.1 hypothetical protein [Virgibacillus sp. AGTR]
MLKVIIGYVIVAFILGVWFNLFFHISEKKLWRVVNCTWGFGITIIALGYPIVSTFQVSFSMGFKLIVVISILSIGGLVMMKFIYMLVEKGIMAMEKIEHKFEEKG